MRARPRQRPPAGPPGRKAVRPDPHGTAGRPACGTTRDGPGAPPHPSVRPPRRAARGPGGPPDSRGGEANPHVFAHAVIKNAVADLDLFALVKVVLEHGAARITPNWALSFDALKFSALQAFSRFIKKK